MGGLLAPLREILIDSAPRCSSPANLPAALYIHLVKALIIGSQHRPAAAKLRPAALPRRAASHRQRNGNRLAVPGIAGTGRRRTSAGPGERRGVSPPRKALVQGLIELLCHKRLLALRGCWTLSSTTILPSAGSRTKMTSRARGSRWPEMVGGSSPGVAEYGSLKRPQINADSHGSIRVHRRPSVALTSP